MVKYSQYRNKKSTEEHLERKLNYVKKKKRSENTKIRGIKKF